MTEARTLSIYEFARAVHKRTGGRGLVVLALAIFSSLTEGISLLLLIPIISVLGPQGESSATSFSSGLLGAAFDRAQALPLEGILAGFVGIIALRAMLTRWKDIQVNALLHDYVHGLQSSLFASVAGARWSYLSTLRGADINHALLAEVERVHRALAQLIFLAQTLIVLAVYSLVALVVSPAMALFGVTLGVLILSAMTPIRRAARVFGMALSERRIEQYRIVSEFITGLKAAKAVNSEPLYFDLLRKSLHEIRKDTITFMRIHTLGGLIFQVAAAAGLATFAYLALGPLGLDYGSTIALILLFIRAAPQITAVQGSWQDLNASIPAVTAMYRLRSDAIQNQEAMVREQKHLPQLRSEINFKTVSYTYPGNSSPTLNGVDFVIPVNEVTAIIGPSGSGKTTIADVLMGLLEPTSGTIMMDGIELAAENRRLWRDSISYVAQDSFLIHDTLAANLAFGRIGITEEDMWNALTTASADGFVRELDDGLQTVVGDRGLRLSGGERQRITLARALLRKPQLLILDEATSALDWENQAIIAKAINDLRGTVTVVTIAHRPSLISFADWVVALREGNVVETGSYAQIAASSDSYLAQVIRSEG